MTTRLEPLNLRITGSSRGLSTELNRARRDTRSFSQSVEAEGRRINEQFSAIRSAIALAVPAGAFAGAGFGLRLAGEAEQAEVAFRVLLGSAEEAQALLQDLSDFSASTPFQFPDIRDSARLLVAFGFSAEEVNKELEILGNLAAGTGNPINQLAELIGKARVQNQIFSEDLNQLTGRGINVLDGLAERFGVAGAEVKKLASEGKIQFADLQAVLEGLATGSGQFAGLMEQQAETLNGSWSTFQDNVGLLAQDFGNLLLPVARDTVQAATALVASIREIDTETAAAAAQWAAFGVTFAATVALFPRLIALGAQLIATVRSLTTAIITAQAVSGPKGWVSLAAGLAFAGASVVAVDSLFASFNETQTESIEAADKSAEAYSKLAAEIDAASEALGGAAGNQQEWVKAAERFRKEFETPSEKYNRRLEELREAVRSGGLEFDIFARGVAAAAAELQGAAAAADQFARPEFLNPDSAEFIRRQFERQRGNGGTPAQDAEADRAKLARDEVAALREEIERTRADNLNASLSEAKRRAEEIAAEIAKIDAPIPREIVPASVGQRERLRFQQSESFSERTAIVLREMAGLLRGDFNIGTDPSAVVAAQKEADERTTAAQERQAAALETLGTLMERNVQLMETLNRELERRDREQPRPLDL